jgi:hypothetical protein
VGHAARRNVLTSLHTDWASSGRLGTLAPSHVLSDARLCLDLADPPCTHTHTYNT